MEQSGPAWLPTSGFQDNSSSLDLLAAGVALLLDKTGRELIERLLLNCPLEKGARAGAGRGPPLP